MKREFDLTLTAIPYKISTIKYIHFFISIYFLEYTKYERILISFNFFFLVYYGLTIRDTELILTPSVSSNTIHSDKN